MFGSSKRSQQEWEDFEAEALPWTGDLYRIARWMSGNREEAEDLVQETLSQALRSFHRYEKGTNCRAWMTKIMYHVNGKRLRKLGRMRLVDDPEDAIVQAIPFEPPIPASLTDEDIIAAVKRVPDLFREIVLLADVEEFSYKEIAAMLQIPIGTVMSRLHRGRKLLRLELGDVWRKGATGTYGS